MHNLKAFPLYVILSEREESFHPNITLLVGCGTLDAPPCSRCDVTIKQCGRAWKPAPTKQSTKIRSVGELLAAPDLSNTSQIQYNPSP